MTIVILLVRINVSKAFLTSVLDKPSAAERVSRLQRQPGFVGHQAFRGGAGALDRQAQDFSAK